jgi:NAD(P)-dependent dehydrogenase (short-subunit alcohol dehydrogenase family)
MASLLRFDGRAAVVTGAARGLGRAIARRLLEAGATVVMADMDSEAVELAAEEEGGRAPEGARALSVAVDVRDQEAMHAVGDFAVEEGGGLDVWVNNAGIFSPANPVSASSEEFERIVGINLTGTHLGCQVAADRMVSGGVIVNIASTAAYRGAGAYSASKWGVRGITAGLAAYLGPRGIRVVAVAPSLVETPGIRATRDRGGERMDEVLDGIVSALPLGRAGSADEIARVVLFLASDAASFVTGATLPVDGGELSA